MVHLVNHPFSHWQLDKCHKEASKWESIDNNNNLSLLTAAQYLTTRGIVSMNVKVPLIIMGPIYLLFTDLICLNH